MVTVLPSESVGVTIQAAEGCVYRINSKYGFARSANVPIQYIDVSLSDMGFGFNGSSSYIKSWSTGKTNAVKSVEMQVYLNTTTEYILNLNTVSGIRIWANAGTITATGFTSPTIYVNGVVSSTVAANTWYDIVITTATAVNASTINPGYANSSYLDGYIKNVSLYNQVLTAQEIADRYNRYTFGGHL